MSVEEKPIVAFVLSLIGGIFILLGGGMMSMFTPYGLGGMMGGYSGYGGYGGNGWFGGMMNGYSGYGGYGGNGWYGGMMGGYFSSPGFGMMGGYGVGGIFGLAGIVFGIVVVVSAVMLYNKPIEHSKWGLLILIFSVLSILGSAMAGFGVGLILGVLGGIFALTWKHQPHRKGSSNLTVAFRPIFLQLFSRVLIGREFFLAQFLFAVLNHS